jgi:hypothetical protein
MKFFIRPALEYKIWEVLNLNTSILRGIKSKKTEEMLLLGLKISERSQKGVLCLNSESFWEYSFRVTIVIKYNSGLIHNFT